MCELFTISAGTFGAMQTAAISVTVFDALMVAGTIATTIQSFNQADAQKDQFAYQAALEHNKAIIQNRKAKDSIARGDQEAKAKKSQIKTIQGRQLVAMAGQGGDVSSGSNVDLLAETKELGELEQERIRNNAAREANSFQIGATTAEANAQGAQLASNQINPLLNATATGLQGFGEVGSKWYNRGVA